MKSLFPILFFCLALVAHDTYAQKSLEEQLSDLDAELDAIFANKSDSISLTSLLNQLLETSPKYSELQLGLAYSSRVTSAGREFGVDQQGITPRVSFYHYSGVYGDISGFWNSDLDPKYNLSVATLGYLGRFNKQLSYGLSYDHSFYNDQSEDYTLTNSLSASATYDFKHFYSGVDYSFSFGTETAHRFIWNLTGKIKLKGFGPFKSISLLPSIAVLFGNQDITTQYTNSSKLNQFLQLNGRDYRKFAGNLKREGYEFVNVPFLQNLSEDIESNQTLSSQQNEVYDLLFVSPAVGNSFDLLNYYFTLPVLLQTKQMNIYLSYNYNIPNNAENATYQYEKNGYFGISVSRNFQFKKKTKLPLDSF